MANFKKGNQLLSEISENLKKTIKKYNELSLDNNFFLKESDNNNPENLVSFGNNKINEKNSTNNTNLKGGNNLINSLENVYKDLNNLEENINKDFQDIENFIESNIEKKIMNSQ